MKIAFNTPARRRTVVAVAIVLTVAYVGLSACRFAASKFGSRESDELKDAAFWHPLCGSFKTGTDYNSSCYTSGGFRLAARSVVSSGATTFISLENHRKVTARPQKRADPS